VEARRAAAAVRQHRKLLQYTSNMMLRRHEMTYDIVGRLSEDIIILEALLDAQAEIRLQIG
jgi:hypothetical protein